MVGTTLFFINVEGLTSRQAPGYENIDFMTFFDVRALKWPPNGPEPKKITDSYSKSFQLSNDIYHVRI